MKSSLFTRVGWFYLPNSVVGCVLYLLAAGFCATVFFAADRHSPSVSDTLYAIYPFFAAAFCAPVFFAAARHSHSVSDTFYGIYPFFVATFLLLDWIARRLNETPNQLPEPTLASGTSPAGQEPRHR